MSGYENVVLDNERLLGSLSFVIKDGIYYPAFNKSALSIINNVIAAKNAQAKWIVNHPIVIYEYYLLRKSMGISFKKLFEDNFLNGEDVENFDDFIDKVFSSISLSENGNILGKLSFLLLSDVDVIYYMKNYLSNEDVSEFFKRDIRKSPIWKSHEEYRYCLNSIEKASEVADFFKPLLTYLDDIEDLYHPKRINDELYESIKNKTDIYKKEALIQILDVLKEYCETNYTEFEFVALPAKNKFKTEINGKQMFIRFADEENDYTPYDAIQNDNPSIENRQYEFFYLYSKTKISSKFFLQTIQAAIHNLTEVRC